MATLFIADLHLGRTGDHRRFLRFSGEARKADALYILGDLFEARSATTIPIHFITRWPQRSKRYPIPAFPVISFMVNRDFLLGKRLP